MPARKTRNQSRSSKFVRSVSAPQPKSPKSSRPVMPPVYGIPKTRKGSLPWEWARKRLTNSHNYLITTVRPDGRPHVMPVWACWYDDSLWFSSSLGSRKARNLASGGWASVATGSTAEPVVIEGAVGRTTDAGEIATFAAATNVKYEVD